MSEPAPVPADQEEALETNLRRVAELGYTVRGQRDPASYMVEAADTLATLRAERDQLASELREAREERDVLRTLLRDVADEADIAAALSDPRPSPAKGDDHGA